VRFFRSGIPASTDFNTDALTSFGSNQAHSNLMPFLCVHFIIALYGIYPSPS
jgi:microcystin-dependent protein